MNARRRRMRNVRASLAVLSLGFVAAHFASCASLDFERDTETSGTFTSSALAFTFLSFDVPAPALSIARANAADSGRPELIVEYEAVFPYLWKLDWILDIFSIRYARVTGTWGNPDD